MIIGLQRLSDWLEREYISGGSFRLRLVGIASPSQWTGGASSQPLQPAIEALDRHDDDALHSKNREKSSLIPRGKMDNYSPNDEYVYYLCVKDNLRLLRMRVKRMKRGRHLSQGFLFLKLAILGRERVLFQYLRWDLRPNN